MGSSAPGVVVPFGGNGFPSTPAAGAGRLFRGWFPFCISLANCQRAAHQFRVAGVEVKFLKEKAAEGTKIAGKLVFS